MKTDDWLRMKVSPAKDGCWFLSYEVTKNVTLEILMKNGMAQSYKQWSNWSDCQEYLDQGMWEEYMDYDPEGAKNFLPLRGSTYESLFAKMESEWQVLQVFVELVNTTER